MQERILQLADEVKQIIEQYKKEVPTGRRTWPKSVRERVIEIRRLGLSSKKVFRLTGVPEPTVWLWTPGAGKGRGSRSKFLPVQVTSTVIGTDLTAKSESLTVKSQLETLVELPGGIKIRGLDLDSIVALSRKLVQ